MTEQERSRWLDAYRDGDLRPDEARQLADLLRQGGPEAEAFLADLQAAGLIAQALANTDAEAFARGFAERLQAETSSERFVVDFQERAALPPRGRRLRARLGWAAGLAASVVLAAVLVFSLSERPVQAHGTARIEEVEGEVFLLLQNLKVAAHNGQEMLSGQGIQVAGERGRAVVVFPDESRLEVGAGTAYAEYNGAPARKVILDDESFVIADVEQPMLLVTPHAEVSAKQTRVSLANGVDGTHVEVRAGAGVELKRLSDGKLVDLRRGFSAVASPLPALLAPRPLAPRYQAPRATLRGHTKYVTCVAFSPDGKTVASGAFDNNICLWDVASGKLKATLEGHTAPVRSVCFHPGSNLLASGSDDRTVRLWNLAASKTEQLIDDSQDGPNAWAPVTCLAFTRDGRFLVTGGLDKTVRIRELAGDRERIIFKGRKGTGRIGRIWSMALSPDETVIAAGCESEPIKVFDLVTNQARPFLQHARRVLGLAYSADGSLIASAGDDQTVKLWDAATGKELATLFGHHGKVEGLAFAPTGSLLASADTEGILKLWDAKTREEIAAFAGHHRNINAIAFSPDGKTIVSVGDDQTVRLWDVPATSGP
ncbi:MAG: hypothetical protein AB7K24_00010 [Gemmataceae bacterium]